MTLSQLSETLKKDPRFSQHAGAAGISILFNDKVISTRPTNNSAWYHAAKYYADNVQGIYYPA